MAKQSTYDADKFKMPLKLLSGFALIVSLVYLLAQSVMSGVDYLNQHQVNTALDKWYESGEAASLIEWEDLETLMLSSGNRNGSNTMALHTLGRLYDYRSTKMSKSRKEQLLYGERAIAYYKLVTQKRPVWPYGWMNLALAKARLGHLDDEFKLALYKLLKTGPWEQITLPAIMQLSLYAWHNLDDRSHEQLLDFYLVAQDKRAADVQKVLQTSGKLEFYCRLVSQRAARPTFCR